MPFKNPAVIGDRLATNRLTFTDDAGNQIMSLTGDGLSILDADSGDLIATLGPGAAANGGTLGVLQLRSVSDDVDYQGAELTVNDLSGQALYAALSAPGDSEFVNQAVLYLVTRGTGDPALIQVAHRGAAGLAIDATEATYMAVQEIRQGETVSVPGSEPLLETWHQADLSAGWAALGGVELDPLYRRGVQGDVQLAGRAKSSSVVSDPATIFTLPVGYRPAIRVVLPTMINSPSAAAVLVVDTDGTVNLQNFSGSITVHSVELTGMSFPLDTTS